MPRISFKKEMATLVAIEEKKATTRYKLHEIGIYDAVKGSRFKPEKFARIYLYETKKTTWHDVIDNHYREEGFLSPIAMVDYLTKNKLIDPKKDQSIYDNVYFHRFILVKQNPRRLDG